MDTSYIEVSSTTIDAAIKMITGGIVAGIGWMVKRQLKLQEKQHHIQQEQAKDIAEIKSDFKITNMRYDVLQGEVKEIRIDVEKLKEKIY